VSEVRRLVGAVIAVMGLGTGVFGVVRGLSSTGPAHGVRMVVAIGPPVDAAVIAMAEHVAKTRLEETGVETRVNAAGEMLVVEVGETDEQIVDLEVALLERTAKLEVHVVDGANPWLGRIAAVAATDPAAREAGIRVDGGVLVAKDRTTQLSVADADAIGCAGRVEDGKRRCVQRGADVLVTYVSGLEVPPTDRLVAYGPTEGGWRPYVLERDVVLDGSAIRRAEVFAGGVAIEADAPRVKPNLTLAFVLDGKVHGVATADIAAPPKLHVLTSGANEAAAFRAAHDLVDVIEAGAAHPLHVTHRMAFERATGFVPRAWPFFAVGGVLLLVGAFVATRR
jgi:hypothetical protein